MTKSKKLLPFKTLDFSRLRVLNNAQTGLAYYINILHFYMIHAAM